MSGNTDRLAQIEIWVLNGNEPAGDDVLSLVGIAKAAREAANPMTPDGRAAPFMWLPANEALRAALSALDGSDT